MLSHRPVQESVSLNAKMWTKSIGLDEFFAITTRLKHLKYSLTQIE